MGKTWANGAADSHFAAFLLLSQIPGNHVCSTSIFEAGVLFSAYATRGFWSANYSGLNLPFYVEENS